jgi:hypothetical protein
MQDPSSESNPYQPPGQLLEFGEAFGEFDYDDYCRQRNNEHTSKLLAAFILPPVFVVAIASQLPFQGLLAAAVTFVVATLVGGIVYRLVGNRLYACYDDLAELLAKRFASQSPCLEAGEHWIVGLSPADRPQQYDNTTTTWDAGYLFFFRDHLVYAGTKARFALPRKLITKLGSGPSAAEKWYPQRLYGQWTDPNDPARGVQTLNFSARAGKTIRQGRHHAREFIAAARNWHSGKTEHPPAPKSFAMLPLPALPRDSGLLPRAAIPTAAVVVMCVMLSGGSLLCLWVLSFLISISSWLWYVAPFASMAVFAINLWPVYRLPDRPAEIAVE